jgi:hypothetical protein
MSSPLPVDDPLLAVRLLGALPAAVFLIDGVGTILSATDQAAALVELDAPALRDRSVLDFVDAETAWAYAATVAMATDYPDVIMGPMRITVIATSGTRRNVERHPAFVICWWNARIASGGTVPSSSDEAVSTANRLRVCWNR